MVTYGLLLPGYSQTMIDNVKYEIHEYYYRSEASHNMQQ